jgi:thioredoxin 1
MTTGGIAVLSSGRTTMKPKHRVVVAMILAAAVGGVLVLKARERSVGDAAADTQEQRAATSIADARPQDSAAERASQPSESEGAINSESAALPTLVDLGADKCIPCKAMAPILEELKADYADEFEVVFIDVWKNPEAGKEYEVQMIPTQIFFDADGNELFRHTGFFGKEDILAKWKELGVL